MVPFSVEGRMDALCDHLGLKGWGGHHDYQGLGQMGECQHGRALHSLVQLQRREEVLQGTIVAQLALLHVT